MPFWKKSKEASGGKGSISEKALPRSISLGGGFRRSSNFDNPGSTKGILADFLAQNENITTVDLGSAKPSMDALVRQKSRLSKTVNEVLHDHNALGYFIQYLEARDAVQLVKFWLDVQSFRSSASMKITTSYVPPKVDPRKLECVPEDPSDDPPGLHLKPAKDSLSSSGNSPLKLPTPSRAAVTTSPISDNTLQRASFPTSDLAGAPAGPDSPAGGEGSTESFDSGFSRSDCDNINNDDSSVIAANTSGLSQASGASILSHPEQDFSRGELLIKARTEDAVKIYRRYIAPDCARPVHLPTETKRNIVEKICAESGLVKPSCFDEAQEKMVEILETDYFPDFLQSEYNAKHQVDVLTSGQVYLTDILYNETALFHFMEFMETEGRRAVVEFWMAANNFHQSLEWNPNREQAVKDAMVLYDKFFSMQATSPLGFSDSIRLEVESSICSDEGPSTSCFSRPLQLIMKYLDTMYLNKFLQSQLYKNYLKELLSTIQSSPRGLSQLHSSHRTRRSPSQDSLSDCSSETTSSISTHNTLLAMASRTRPVIKNIDHRDMAIDYGELANPDALWKRENVRNKIGRINALGRYEPGFDLAPDMNRNEGTKSGSKLGRAVRKLVTNEQHEQMKEEMAWQVAEMIIKDVTSVTMPGPGHSSKRRFNSSDDAVTTDPISMRKSKSESCSFLAQSSELPQMKYF